MNPRTMSKNPAWLVAVAATLAGCAEPGPVGTLRVDRPVFELRYPEAAALQLTWQPTRPLDEVADKLDGRPTVFVHLLSESGGVVRTFDHLLPAPWEPGVRQQYSIDVSQSALTAPLAAGSYGLSVGLYHVDWGYRWPIETDGLEVATREYRVATVEVPAYDDDREGPRLAFTGGWFPAERRDQQVPARRRLAADAGVRASGLGGPGALLFVLTVGDEAGPRPVVEVTSDCDGSRRQRIGAGSHAITVEATASDPSAEACTVDFLPRGSLTDCGVQCPVYLEQAAFRPDPP